MTRAQQSISLGLLVISVRTAAWGFYHSLARIADLWTSQLYLACFLQLIPFTLTVQTEIIPVVRIISSHFLHD